MSSKERNQSRRSFLKTGTAGLAGAAMIPSILSAAGSSQEKKGKLIFRKFGKTGLKLPVVSMGVMNADNPKLVEAALDAGILHLDTAWYYQMGRNETMVGEVVKNRKRDSYVVATKVWEPRDRQTGLFPEDATAVTFMAKFETSLKRLGLDYVDVLYLHNISNSKAGLFPPYVEAMQKLKKQGKIRFIGISTHRNEAEVIRTAVKSKIYEVVLTAYNFKHRDLVNLDKAIAEAAAAGLAVVAMKTQAGVYWDAREKQNPINMKAALKWALQNKNIHTAIPGFTTFDQLELDLSVMQDLTLTPQEKKDLKLDQKTLAGFYCQQCEQCLTQCSSGIDIPTLMRSYMYAYAYKNVAMAKQTLAEAELDKFACDKCTSCLVNCSMGFNIKERAEDIYRLKDVPVEFLG